MLEFELLEFLNNDKIWRSCGEENSFMVILNNIAVSQCFGIIFFKNPHFIYMLYP